MKSRKQKEFSGSFGGTIKIMEDFSRIAKIGAYLKLENHQQ